MALPCLRLVVILVALPFFARSNLNILSYTLFVYLQFLRIFPGVHNSCPWLSPAEVVDFSNQ